MRTFGFPSDELFQVVKPIVGDRGTVTLSATKTDGLIEVAGRGSPTVQR
ncbi:Cof-like hydrolase [Cutibacterium modestum P08]|nr:Cof-like hydrolase [Cutibacterium modestum P08]